MCEQAGVILNGILAPSIIFVKQPHVAERATSSEINLNGDTEYNTALVFLLRL